MAVFPYLVAPDGGGNSVPGYLQNGALQLGAQLTAGELEQALQNGHDNPNLALVALLRLPEKLSQEHQSQLQNLDQRLSGQEGETVRRLRVALVAVMARDGSAESCRYLREIYDRDPTRRVEVALGLAETSAPENWSYLIRSLPILDANDQRQILVKLRDMRQWPTDAESYRQVILAAQRLADQGAADAISLLEHWQGFAPSGDQIPWQDAVIAWKKWFRQTYPQQPVPELAVSQTAGKWDAQALQKHLGRSELEGGGSVINGKAVFVKAQCANCHRLGEQGEAMGPDLTGIGKRFLLREILDSILYPSKVISDQYAAKIVTTDSGKTYSGIVAQGPGESLTILQADGTKVRVPQQQVDEMEPSGISAMPEGLLDTLTLEEVSDLFAALMSDPRRTTQVQPAAARR